jgi:hypothetical protein
MTASSKFRESNFSLKVLLHAYARLIHAHTHTHPVSYHTATHLFIHGAKDHLPHTSAMFPTFVPGAFKDCAHQSPFLSDSLLHVGLPASLVLTVLRLLLATTLPLTVNPITCDGGGGGREVFDCYNAILNYTS